MHNILSSYFSQEPIVTDRYYIGWGYEYNIHKIIVKPHPRLAVGYENGFYI